MSKKHGSQVGVDLGAHSIKIQHKASSGKVIHRAYPVPQDTGRKAYLMLLRSSIQDFMKRYRILSAAFSFTVPCDGIEGRIQFLTVPLLDKKSLGKAMKYEIEDGSSIDNLDFYHAQWQMVAENPDENRIHAIASVMKRDIVAEISKLRKISWTIESIEFQPITIGRLVSGNAVVVDYGHKNTLMYFYLDSVLADIVTIPSGGIRLEEIIRELMPEAAPEDIAAVKKETFFYGMPTHEGKDPWETTAGTTGETIAPPVEIDINDLSNLEFGFDKDLLMEISLRVTQEAKYITEEVKRHIRSFELKHSILADNLYYSGEAFNLQSFPRFIAEDLEMPVLPLSSLLEEDLDAEGSRAFTLACAAVKARDIGYLKGLNFAKLARNSVDFGSLAVATLIMVTLLHAGVYHVHGLYQDKLDSATEMKTTQELTLADLNMYIQRSQQEKAQEEQVSSMVKQLGRERKWLSEFLYVLPRITPNGVAVKKVTAQNGIVIIRGYSRNYSNIGFFAMELEKLGPIHIDYIDKDEDPATETVNRVVITNIFGDDEEVESIETSNEFTIRLETSFPLRKPREN